MSALNFRLCPICKSPVLNPKREFCSRTCRYTSLRKRISLECHGCRKVFKILPYLKRKTNYCSLDCYHNFTKKSEIRICQICQNEFLATGAQIKNGFGIFCSRKCQHQTYKEKRQILKCKQCGKEIAKPPSVAKLTKFCSKICHDDYMRDYVSRTCHHCGKEFQLPTWETNKGKGVFCSRYCYVHYNGESGLEAIMRQALEKLKVNFKQEVKFGRYHADFVLPERKIIIECDSYWHESENAKARDSRKDLYIQRFGYKIFRFDENQIKKSALKCLENLFDSESPNSLHN